MHELDDPQRLERHLHQAIPLSAAMRVHVREAGRAGVRLTAPLAPNINHMQTLFGGSAVAVATLAAWALLTLRLSQEGVPARVVIQRSAMHHTDPVDADFEAVCEAVDETAWQRFLTTLQRRRRARITLTAQLRQAGQPAASFEGDFVALL